MKLPFKTGKINFEQVLAASVAGMGYTVVTNAISNSTSSIGAKWNENKDLNYAIGATALGAGLIYFLPKQKWSNAAGLGLIGAGGAIAAQVITGKIRPNSQMNGFFGNALRAISRSTPAAQIADPDSELRKLLNRAAGINQYPDGSSRKIVYASGQPVRNKLRKFRDRYLNGVEPQSYGQLASFDALGLN
jgi:hypothetical protein